MIPFDELNSFWLCTTNLMSFFKSQNITYVISLLLHELLPLVYLFNLRSIQMFIEIIGLRS